jgi:murein DD-endopeptidase MepM/ murein hydrolase activator NlpD
MISPTHKKQKARGFNALILCGLLMVGLSGCAQIQSGRWYDSDTKTKQTTKSKQQADDENRTTGFWENLRAKLDRRPEAKKARHAAENKREAATSKRKATYTTSTKTPKGLLVVEKGDTYYSLARKYDVPLRAFLELNSAKPPYILSPGDRVRLPTQAFYEVKKKDTLYSISRAHNTDVATLAQQNGLAKPFTISVGQRLQIPGLQTAAASPRQPQVKTNKTAKRKAEPSAPKRVGRFLVPVKGSIISSYGPKDGGLHNDGINIAAREGAPIRAAENGVVVYTGNELRGYGNLLLIRHSGGWVTAYAHTSKFLVKPGVRVKQGQIVAEVGRTGNVDRPQLHFELRKGTRAVNPQSLI